MTNPGNVPDTTGSPTSTNQVIEELWDRIMTILGQGSGVITMTDVNNAIATAIAGKANTSDVTNSLAGKANQTDLTNGLAAKANSSDVTTSLAGKANSSHTHTSAQVTDFTAQVQSVVAALIKAGSNVTTSYDSTAKTLTINSIGGGGGGTTDAEVVRDTIGAALVAGTGVTINVDDPNDTITISVAAVPIASINAAGTRDATTFLRGDGNWATVSKSQVGLGNVDNTSDANKPVSTATATALGGKSNTGHTHSVSDLTATGTKDATTYLAGDNTFKPISSLGATTPATRSAPFCFEMCHTAIGSAALAGFHLRRPFMLGIKPERFRVHFCNRVQLSDAFIAGEAGKLYGLNVVIGKPAVDSTTGDYNGNWTAAPLEILAATDVAAGTIASTSWVDASTFPVDLDVMQMIGYSFQSGNTSSGQVAYNGGFSFRDSTPGNLKTVAPATPLTRSDNASFLQVIVEYEHKDSNATHLLNIGNSLSGPSANSGATPLPITNVGEFGTFHQIWARRHRCSAASVAVAGAYASHFLGGNGRLNVFDNFNIPYVPDVIFAFAAASSDIADCTAQSTANDIQTNIRNVIRNIKTKYSSTLKHFWTNVPPRNNFTGSRATNTTNEYWRHYLNNWLSNTIPMSLSGVVDVDEMLSDFADPARLKYPFTTEGVHLTVRAHQNISEKVPAGRK